MANNKPVRMVISLERYKLQADFEPIGQDEYEFELTALTIPTGIEPIRISIVNTFGGIMVDMMQAIAERTDDPEFDYDSNIWNETPWLVTAVEMRTLVDWLVDLNFDGKYVERALDADRREGEWRPLVEELVTA